MTGGILERERLPLAVQAVLTVALVALTRTVGLPEPVRAIGALVAVLLVPGAALVLLWPGNATRGWLPVVALSFPLSLLAVSGAALAGWLLAWGPLPLAAGYLFGTFLLTLAALVRVHQAAPEEKTPPWGRLSRGFSLAVTGLLLGAALVAVWAGAPTGPVTDGPDHMAAVEEIRTSQEMFPHQGLVPPGELERSDPRKGVLHVGMAMAAELADVSTRQVWTAAPAVLVVSWLALVVLLGLELGLGRGGAWMAGVLALVFLGGNGGAWAVRLGYGAHAGLVVAWAASWVLLELLRGFGWWRAALLGILVAVGAAVHPMAPAFFFLPAVLLPVTGWKGRPFPLGSLGKALLVSLMVLAPVVLLRVPQLRGAVNPLHRQAMPVLELAKGWSVLWPPAWFRILGPVGVVGVLLLPAAAGALKDRLGRRYLVAATAAALGPALLPGVFDLGAAWTSSLPIKLLYLTPYFWIGGVVLGSGWTGKGKWLRGALVVGLLACLPAATARFAPGRVAGWRPSGIEPMLETLRAMPRRSVVADKISKTLI